MSDDLRISLTSWFWGRDLAAITDASRLADLILDDPNITAALKARAGDAWEIGYAEGHTDGRKGHPVMRGVNPYRKVTP